MASFVAAIALAIPASDGEDLNEAKELRRFDGGAVADFVSDDFEGLRSVEVDLNEVRSDGNVEATENFILEQRVDLDDVDRDADVIEVAWCNEVERRRGDVDLAAASSVGRCVFARFLFALVEVCVDDIRTVKFESKFRAVTIFELDEIVDTSKPN